jgi:hypothetical protein
MKKLAIAVFAIMLILGMSSMATAQLSGGDGTYEFYGTYSVEQYDTDGASPHACTMALNGQTCPSTANVCIKNLVVTGGGTQIDSGDPGPYYGIAVGMIPGTFIDLDPDATGPVNLTVGSSGSDDRQQLMSVSEYDSGGSCAGAGVAAVSPCIQSFTGGPTGGGGAANTVTGDIPAVDKSNPLGYLTCTGGGAAYPPSVYTTETVTVQVSNESQPPNDSLSQTGSRLVGDHLTLKQANVRLRLTIGPITLGTDTMGFITMDGDFCKGVGCIPVACPAEND